MEEVSAEKLAQSVMQEWMESKEVEPLVLAIERAINKAAKDFTSWKPIETAPKDGSRFDAWIVDPDRENGGYRETDCRWDERMGEFVNKMRCGLTAMIPITTGIPLIYPSHWRSIPEPPKQ